MRTGWGPVRRVVAGVVSGALLAGALLLSLLAFMPTPARASAASDAAQFLADTNRERAANGVAPLATNDALVGIAQRWSAQMAGSTHLAHNPDLFNDIDRYVTPNWAKVAENVGTGPDVETIQAAFVKSPEHHQNMIDPALTEVGIAVAYSSNGALWVTLDFLEPAPTRQVVPAAANAAPHGSTPAPAVAAAPHPTGTTAPAPPVTITLTPVVAPSPAALDQELSFAPPAPIDVGGLGSSAPALPALPGHRRLRVRAVLEIGDAVLIAGIIGVAIRLGVDLRALSAEHIFSHLL